MLKVCSLCELSISGYDETSKSLKPGNYRSIFEVLCEDAPVLRDHCNNFLVFKGTPKTIHSELLNCMYALYGDHTKGEIKSCVFRFKLTKSLMVTILHCCWTLRTIYVKGKMAVGLWTAIKSVLQECEVIKHKLTTETYDGNNVIRDRWTEFRC